NSIKRALEEGFGHVRVRGEMGRITLARSGHVYVDLKDANAVLSAVMWKGVAAGLRFKLEEGLEVIATGKISSFPGSSKYQLIIDRIEPAGIGALLAQLEERRKRLAAEGLFAQERKQALPFLPRVIGVVTSPTGAVIRDILHRLSDRFPVHVIVWPVLVQGDKAAGQVARAIEGFNAIAQGGEVPRPDLLIVARGGGSIEDLWAFNEEIVVRAAAASAIPLISAIGHETDTTLIDFAADQRAPTPTGAAEMAVRVRTELLERMSSQGNRLTRALLRVVERQRQELRAIGARLPRPDALFSSPRQHMDLMDLRMNAARRTLLQGKHQALLNLSNRLRAESLNKDMQRRASDLSALDVRLRAAHRRSIMQAGEALAHNRRALHNLDARLLSATQQNLARALARLGAQSSLLEAFSYKATLARGFALVRTATGKVVRSKADVAGQARLTLTLQDGDVLVQARGAEPIQGSLF
ncbi:MAG: hypothetical protein RLZZ157_810, partial [Pseudomonadota bacterium]